MIATSHDGISQTEVENLFVSSIYNSFINKIHFLSAYSTFVEYKLI